MNWQYGQLTMTKFPFEEILIGSNNLNKLEELNAYFQKHFSNKIIIKTPRDFNLTSPIENANSFEGNSAIKSNYYFEQTGLPVLSDDTGIAVHELMGQPGIHTADWALGAKDFKLAFQRVKDELIKINSKTLKPTATAICVLSFKYNQNQPIFFHGKVDGHLDFSYEGQERGFGFQPIFVPTPYQLPFTKLNEQQKYRISHRARAFRKFLKFIEVGQLT